MKYNLGKKALVYSVPGTGTRFTRQLLEKCFGYTATGIPELRAKPDESRFFTFHHVDAEIWEILTEDHPEIKTVIPLRSPVAQYITRWREMGRGWKARNKAKRYWKLLREGLPRYNYVFLPLEEGHDRAGLIWRVANHLEILPDADVLEHLCKVWPKVGTAGPRPERKEYDATGKALVDGDNIGFLDEEMEWYRQVCEVEHPQNGEKVCEVEHPDFARRGTPSNRPKSVRSRTPQNGSQRSTAGSTEKCAKTDTPKSLAEEHPGNARRGEGAPA